MDIAARIINFSLMIAMPIGLAIALARRHKTEWRLFGIGAVTFVLSQILHIPFNQWVLNPFVESMGLNLEGAWTHLVLLGLLYGLSAGVFEEVFRYIGFRFWIREERDWKSSLMVGAGHGGIESFLLGVVVLYGFIQAVTLRGTDLSTVVSADQLELATAQMDAYWAAPWHMAILGAVERFATILFHISASVLVLQAFRRKNMLWVAIAIGWHTILDAVAVIASKTWSPYITEGIILIFGFISLGMVFILKPNGELLELKDQPVQPDAPVINPIEIKSVEPSEEDLENSRYA